MPTAETCCHRALKAALHGCRHMRLVGALLLGLPGYRALRVRWLGTVGAHRLGVKGNLNGGAMAFVSRRSFDADHSSSEVSINESG